MLRTAHADVHPCLHTRLQKDAKTPTAQHQQASSSKLPTTASSGCYPLVAEPFKSPIPDSISQGPPGTVSYTHLTLPTICSV
eukprot:6335006-Alexandrium_andersonii.AAC.1